MSKTDGKQDTLRETDTVGSMLEGEQVEGAITELQTELAEASYAEVTKPSPSTSGHVSPVTLSVSAPRCSRTTAS